jgi:2-polyprenyl-3-methyl-5-hydroxy-6-metoxy-1,4-benzoquinol methylase
MAMQDLFVDKARDWDSRPAPQVISEGVGSALSKSVSWRPSMRVMDFGAGTGLIASRVAPRVDKIWAVDVSQAMLGELRAKSALEGKVEIVCQDIVTEPLSMTFDVVMSAMALHHVADVRTLFERFFGNLEPGGVVALADLDTEDGTFHAPGTEGVHHHGFDRRELQGWLEAAGFENCRFETAVEVHKNDRVYPVFLVTANKPSS